MDVVVNLCWATLNQWKKARDISLFPSMNTSCLAEGAKLWTKLDVDNFKINIDAAIFEKEDKFGYNGVIKDHHRFVVAGISGLKEGIVLPELLKF
uniref:Uncharacterized protein n=1 Tax=Cannabis sativa TaxID=3483 RepID=A0A803NTS8_CANSA